MTSTCRSFPVTAALRLAPPPPAQFEGERDVAYRSGGQTVLGFYGLEGASKWLWLVYESLFFWVFAALLWAALVWVRHQRR